MDKPITVVKIEGVPRNFDELPFGRQIEFNKLIETFKCNAKKDYISQKHISYKKAIKDFIRAMNASQYYCRFWAGENYWDDSFEIYYI